MAESEGPQAGVSHPRTPVEYFGQEKAGVLILGIGNAMRGDDGVGPFVAARLAEAGLPARTHEGDGTGVIDAMSEAPHLILIDATASGAAPGHRSTLDGLQPVPAEFFHYSTHRFGVAEAVETARALGLLPARLTIHGIEGADFSAGERLSAQVAEAAGALISELSQEFAG